MSGLNLAIPDDRNQPGFTCLDFACLSAFPKQPPDLQRLLQGIFPSEPFPIHLPACGSPYYLHTFFFQKKLLKLKGLKAGSSAENSSGIDYPVGICFCLFSCQPML